MDQLYCMKCMRPNGGTDVCPHCGYSETPDCPPHVLLPGTVLNDRYLLGLPIGQGGFGITYIGRDLRLDMRIAVKEYFPNGYANRNVAATERITITDERMRMAVNEGKDRFLKEARAIAQFHGTPGIVDVRDYFEANNTAYIVMEYLEGEDLAHQLKKKLFTAGEIFQLMAPVFDALEKIHRQGIVHRDISPDNIMMLSDGSLKLMDFGAARLANYTDQKSVSVMLKAGYAPMEQYRSRGLQGPWTDIYALCATIYKCITGITPVDTFERAFGDEIKWPSEMNIPITVRQEMVLKKGMSIQQEDRFQTIGELKAALNENVTTSIEAEHITVEPRLEHIKADTSPKGDPMIRAVDPHAFANERHQENGSNALEKRELSRQKIELGQKLQHAILEAEKPKKALKSDSKAEEKDSPLEQKQSEEEAKKRSQPPKVNNKEKKPLKKKKPKLLWVALLAMALITMTVLVVAGQNKRKNRVEVDATIREAKSVTPEPSAKTDAADTQKPTTTETTAAPAFSAQSLGLKNPVCLTMGVGALNEYRAFGEALYDVLNEKTSGMLKVLPQSRMISSLVLYNFGIEYQLGLIKSNDLTRAFNGDFIPGESAVTNLRALAALYSEPVLIFTNDARIKSVSDITNQTIYTNWTSCYSMEANDVLVSFGLRAKEENSLIPEEAIQRLTSDVSTIVVVCGGYDDDVMRYFADESIHLVSIGKEHIEQIIESYSYYNKYTIPKEKYNTKEDYQTIAVKVTLVADASVSDDVAYAIVKTIFENKDEIAAVHAKGAELDLSFAADDMVIPFHPGAIKYYSETGENPSVLSVSDGDTAFQTAYNAAQKLSARRFVAAGDLFTVGIKADGTCIVAGRGAPNLSEWKNIKAISASCDNVMGLQEDGRVRCTDYSLNVHSWDYIIQIDYSVGYIYDDGIELYSHAVGLRADGTVVADGKDRFGECAVDDWRTIIDVAAGGKHTVGLKADGTVIATGNNEYGQCNTSDWENIVDVTAANDTTYGLSVDGIIYVTGKDAPLPPTEKWGMVVSIIAGYECGSAEDYLVGIMSNGNIVTNRNKGYVSEKQTDRFSHVISLATSSWGYIVCVDEFGFCSSVGPEFEGARAIDSWPNIKTE